MMKLYKELGVENVLLIEDDPWSRDSLSTFFGIVQCSMRSAETPMDAVVAASRTRFDLILCEYQIPGMSGITLLNILGDIQPAAVKFLFTSYPVRKLFEAAARSGISEVIRKPFSVETLEESLKRHFPRGRQGEREPVGAR